MGGGNPPSLLIQLFRYFIVGGIAFIADFGLLAFFTEVFYIPYLVSACLSFLAGLIVNYILSIIWVFDSKPQSKSAQLVEFILFAFVGIIGLGLNALIIWSLTESGHLHYLFSKIISTIIVFAWNFFARRFIVSQFQILINRNQSLTWLTITNSK